MRAENWLCMTSSRLRSLFRRHADLDLNEEPLDHDSPPSASKMPMGLHWDEGSHGGRENLRQPNWHCNSSLAA